MLLDKHKTTFLIKSAAHNQNSLNCNCTLISNYIDINTFADNILASNSDEQIEKPRHGQVG